MGKKEKPETQIELEKIVAEKHGQLQYSRRVVENAMDILATVRDRIKKNDPDFADWISLQIKGLESEGVTK